MDLSPPYSVYRSVRKGKGGERTIIIVSGNDPDVVWAAALDVKNGFGAERAPELRGLEPSKVDGWWSCTLIQRASRR